MDPDRFLTFAAEARAQMDEIDSVFDLVEARSLEPGASGTESLGYQIHNLYCACEDLFEVVAETFENHLIANGGYHVELLKRMKIEIPGVRPAAISDRSFELLDSLRGFRHVFRHAYGASLDRRKVDIVLDDARRLHTSLRDEIESFLAAFET